MKSTVFKLSRALWVALLLATACFPQTSAQEPTGPIIKTSTREVLLDLVVRDKHEKLVHNLKPGDVTVLEDGVPQTVKIFRLVSGKEQTATDQAGQSRATASAAGKINPLRALNLISIVFGPMGPRSREYARNAAAEFLKNELLANTYAAVFSLDYRLNPLTNYTRDIAVLTKAIDHAAGANYQEFAKDSENVLNQIQHTVTGTRTGISIDSSFDAFKSPGMASGGAEQASPSAASSMMASIINDNMLVSAYQAGMRSTVALLMLARAQARLPGRKTVLYMADGLILPPDNLEAFRATISEANRANVTFYTLDVRGLSVANPALSGQSALQNAAALSRQQSNESLSGRELAALSHQDDLISYAVQTANTQQSMAELAESTGGFLIANTNDLNRPMRRIMEDVREHYEVVYTPTATTYDGHFRKIEVKLARSGLNVRTRDGYFALPDFSGEPVLPFEMAALTALTSSPAPRDVEYHASALGFRTDKDQAQCAVVFELPMRGLSMWQDTKRNTIRVHASFLALIKNRQGEVVAKVSHDLPAEVPADRLESLRQGNMTFSQPFSVPFGRYTLETAVIDREGNKAGTRRSSFAVTRQPGLALSSISVVRRVDPLKEPRNARNPLEFANGKVTPALEDPTPHRAETELYFVVYPDAAQPGIKPELTVEFWSGEHRISSQMPELPDPDDTGAIPVLTQAKLMPGQYEMRLIGHQGRSATKQAFVFTLE